MVNIMFLSLLGKAIIGHIPIYLSNCDAGMLYLCFWPVFTIVWVIGLSCYIHAARIHEENCKAREAGGRSSPRILRDTLTTYEENEENEENDEATIRRYEESDEENEENDEATS